jgi:hypothetical protein
VNEHGQDFILTAHILAVTYILATLIKIIEIKATAPANMLTKA